MLAELVDCCEEDDARPGSVPGRAVTQGLGIEILTVHHEKTKQAVDIEEYRL